MVTCPELGRQYRHPYNIAGARLAIGRTMAQSMLYIAEVPGVLPNFLQRHLKVRVHVPRAIEEIHPLAGYPPAPRRPGEGFRTRPGYPGRYR